MIRTLRSIVNTKVVTLILSVCVTFFSFSNHHDEHEAHSTSEVVNHAKEVSEAASHEEPGMMEVINHHIGDDHQIEIYHGKLFNDIVLPLPVILFSTDKGLTVALSNKFEHGHKSINGYNLTHHGVLNEAGNHAVNLTTAFSASHGEVFYDLSLTKNVFSMLLSVIILLLLFVPMAKKYKTGVGPKGLQNLLEVLIVFVRDEIVEPNLGNKTAKFLPYLLLSRWLWLFVHW